LGNYNVRFVQDLVFAIPELKPLLANHLADNDELLPHVFIGDLTRFVVTTCHATDGLIADWQRPVFR